VFASLRCSPPYQPFAFTRFAAPAPLARHRMVLVPLTLLPVTESSR
jgi:hypothetical protein